MFRKILNKLTGKKKIAKKQIRKKTRSGKPLIEGKYTSRFAKFYELNKEYVSKYRKKRYEEKKKKGICIKCKKKAIKGINFCAYHRAQTKRYNEKAKRKRRISR